MVSIDARSSELEDVAAQIPEPRTVPAGERIVVFASPARGWLGRVLARDEAPLHVLCSALLARGYVAIGAGREDGRSCAWGHAPGAS